MNELEKIIGELIEREHINTKELNVNNIVAEIKKAYTQAHSTIA